MNLATGYPSEWIEEFHRRKETQADYGLLSDWELVARYAQLLENAIAFDDGGKPFIQRDASQPRWCKRLCWAEIEIERRSSAVGAQRDEVTSKLLQRRWKNIVAARRLWSRVREPEFGRYIVKFSSAEFVLEMYSSGRFQISPATAYKDPSLNPAIQDDERSRCILLPPGTKLSVRVEPDGNYQPIDGISGHLRINRHCDNFWVFCAAGRFDPRLFDEFDADACLLVRDLNKFGLALIHGVAPAIGATHQVHGTVHYLDPIHPDKERLVEMTKPFRYEYQQEWRVVWRCPNPPADDVEPVILELGPLCECCEALYL